RRGKRQRIRLPDLAGLRRRNRLSPRIPAPGTRKVDLFWPFQGRKVLRVMIARAAHRRGLIGMKRSKRSTGWLAAILAGAFAGAAGLYLYAQGIIPPLPAIQGNETGSVPVVSSAAQPQITQPQASAPADAPPKPVIAATGGAAPLAKPMTVPSFDVVLVEPSGEGGLAGRGRTGWSANTGA